MKTTDLRIGNLIVTSGDFGGWAQERSVCASDFEKTAAGTLLLESFNPILIKEKHLEKFGFRFNAEERYYKHNGISVFVGSTTAMIYVHGIRAYGKHVHELQNIFYAIYGEELPDIAK